VERVDGDDAVLELEGTVVAGGHTWSRPGEMRVSLADDLAGEVHVREAGPSDPDRYDLERTIVVTRE